MANFRDRLDEAARRGTTAPAPAHWSKRVLETFVAWLNERSGDDLYARLEGSGAPGVERVMLCPATRPNEATTLLVVQGGGDRAMVLGLGQTIFNSEEAFQNHLLDLVARPEFAQTREMLAGRNREPVEGWLRAGRPRDRQPSRDILVEVPADLQRYISDAWRNKREEPFGAKLRLMPASPIASGDIRLMGGDVRWMLSGGIASELSEPLSLVGEEVELKAIVRPAQ